MKRESVLLICLTLLFLTGVCMAASESKTIARENKSVSLLFVQSAENGTFIAGENDTYTLTLQNAVPYTFYFSDRPDRVAGSWSNEKFIKGMNWTPAPNAAVTLPGADSAEDTVIVELSHPQYDDKSGNLTYTAKIVKDYQDGKLSDFLPNLDPGIPESFGQITLFIDSGKYYDGYCYGSKCCPNGEWSCSP